MNQKSKHQHQVTTVTLFIIITALSFFIGTKHQASKTPIFDKSRLSGMAGRGQGMGQSDGVNMIRGEINQKDGDTLTVKSPDGSSKIVFLSTNTVISKSEQGTTDDLASGDQVVIFGQTNSDGSVSAQNIQLNPNDLHLGRPQ